MHTAPGPTRMSAQWHTHGPLNANAHSAVATGKDACAQQCRRIMWCERWRLRSSQGWICSAKDPPPPCRAHTPAAPKPHKDSQNSDAQNMLVKHSCMQSHGALH